VARTDLQWLAVALLGLALRAGAAVMRAARAWAILAWSVVVRAVIAMVWAALGALCRASEAATGFTGAALRLRAAWWTTRGSLLATSKFAAGVAV
jgi:hypothetical protein